MAKKQFTNSFQDIFSPTETPAEKKEIVPVSEEKDEILRTTLLLSKKTYDSIKLIAYWERKPIKDVLTEALELYIKSKDSGELERARLELKES